MGKRILIIGPIGDIGGRELETGFIAHILSEDYKVQIISTGNFTGKSQIFDFVSNEQMISLNELVVKKNVWFYFFMFLAYFKSFGSGSLIDYARNGISKKIGFKSFAVKQLYNLVDENDIVFLCAQISSNYIKEVVAYASRRNKPVVMRTSNTIKQVNDIDHTWLEKVKLFIHHSSSNANRLNFLSKYKFQIIDQCSFKEEDLLAIEPTKKMETLLYIGRLSQEKGIIELINCFKNIDTRFNLKVIGDGELYEEANNQTKNTKNIKLLGFLNQKEIIEHIESSDAMIIPSQEESGPLVGIEAMASGRILVSTKVGAMTDRLKDSNNQFWFDINDISSLESVLEELQKLTSQNIEIIAKENRERYLECFTKAKIASLYKNAIFNLINTAE